MSLVTQWSEGYKYTSRLEHIHFVQQLLLDTIDRLPRDLCNLITLFFGQTFYCQRADDPNASIVQCESERLLHYYCLSISPLSTGIMIYELFPPVAMDSETNLWHSVSKNRDAQWFDHSCSLCHTMIYAQPNINGVYFELRNGDLAVPWSISKRASPINVYRVKSSSLLLSQDTSCLCTRCVEKWIANGQIYQVSREQLKQYNTNMIQIECVGCHNHVPFSYWDMNYSIFNCDLSIDATTRLRRITCGYGSRFDHSILVSTEKGIDQLPGTNAPNVCDKCINSWLQAGWIIHSDEKKQISIV